ncbi:hypothetical protein AAVH_10350, partial [Aphelenchoides avenae]
HLPLVDFIIHLVERHTKPIILCFDFDAPSSRSCRRECHERSAFMSGEKRGAPASKKACTFRCLPPPRTAVPRDIRRIDAAALRASSSLAWVGRSRKVTPYGLEIRVAPFLE